MPKPCLLQQKTLLDPRQIWIDEFSCKAMGYRYNCNKAQL